ncbi:type I polyketide synthase [Erwinia amylovora]|uniref:type I polyketide synthase n=1 Tax=Erwinia amylovora TaxID=552 RepID=UPI0014444A0C|nr:type I polyketide synthase [Erwinia amylovora]
MTGKVAVIGHSFEFPSVTNINDFWDGLINKRCFYHNAFTEGDEHIDAWGSVVNLKGFDHHFFGYSYNEACKMDPQHRHLLQHCWWAMENAGYMNKKRLPVTAVFASASENHYLLRNLAGELRAGTENEALLGNLPDFLATRIAWKIGATGQAFTLQCGCSSGLAALHQARVTLLTGQAEMALVGAVSLAASHQEGYDYLAGGIRSADGKVRVFDCDASGTVFTNGVAALVLKPLQKALEHGDNILGVLESSALNNDGDDKAGFTAPSVSGQCRVIRRAMKVANIATEEIALYEAHGTGTRLGDPIEFAALSEAWPDISSSEPTCALQSVKANLGHLDTVSGLAGVIKACLVLKHRQLPPQLNFQNPNPHIRLKDSPFFINAEPRMLAEKARFACISALGIGGTNAHVILSGAPETPTSSARPSPSVFLLSAPNQKALGRLQQSWAKWSGDDGAIEKAAAITRLGRTDFRVRQSLVASSVDELKAGISKAVKGTIAAGNAPFVVLMFTGQGAQYAGMGKHLYQISSFFRDRLDEKLAILQQLSGHDYRAILFEHQEDIHKPQHTQPGLLALEVALAEYLCNCGINADLMLGHSLGEYSAMVVAQVLSFSDAASLVLLRAQLVQKTEPGTMCSVMAGVETLHPLLDDMAVDIAALNSATLSVVSGRENEIGRFMANAQQNGIFCQLLKVKRAFHSRLLEPILPAYREALQRVSFSAPRVPVISTLTGCEGSYEQFNQPDYWIRQMREPVAFAAAVKCAASRAENLCFIEVGPGQTLKTLASQNTHHPCINLMPHPAEVENAEKVLATAFGQLWECGVDIQWQNMNDRPIMPASPTPPNYPFELTECWTVPPTRSEHLALQSYQACWVPVMPLMPAAEGSSDWLFITDGSLFTAELAQTLGNMLMQQGAKTRVAEFEADSGSQMLKNAPANIALLFHPDTFRQETFKPLLILLELIRHWQGQGPRRLSIITRAAVDLLTSPCPALAALVSAVKSLNQEYPALATRLIDCDGQDDALLARELTATSPVVVALRHSDRFSEGFLLSPVQENTCDAEIPRSIVILGGGGQVGLQYAKAFLENSQAHVRLLQRSSLASLQSRTDKASVQRASRITDLMRRWPGRLTLGEADVQSHSSLLAACLQAKEEMGSLDTLIHTAGVDASMHYQLIKDVDAQFCHISFAAKSQGLHNMAEVATTLAVPHCHVISSISSALGGIGMYIYGSLHAWLDAAVAELRRQHPSRWTSLNWEAWEFGNDQEVPDDFRQGAFGSELNRYAMQPAEGRRLLWQCWRGLNGQRIISNVDFQHRYREWVENQHDSFASAENESPHKAPRPEMNSEYQSAQNQTEEKIVAVWESLLGLKGIGIDDNFFELGGHSLLALRMTGQVNQLVNSAMSMVDIFQYPTIRKLAASVTETRDYDAARNDAVLRAQKRRRLQSSKRA